VLRIGRTGRAGAEGIAMSFCDVDEKPYLKDIEKLIGKKIPVVTNQPYPLDPNAKIVRPEKQARPERTPRPERNSKPQQQKKSAHESRPSGEQNRKQQHGFRSRNERRNGNTK